MWATGVWSAAEDGGEDGREDGGEDGREKQRWPVEELQAPRRQLMKRNPAVPPAA